MITKPKVKVFFIVDLSDSYFIGHTHIRKKLLQLLDLINKDTATLDVEAKVIGMGTVTQIIGIHDPWNKLGGDFNRALEIVEKSAPLTDTISLVELFVLLRNEPQGINWYPKIRELKKRKNVTVRVIDCAEEEGHIRSETIQEIKTTQSYRLSKPTLDRIEKVFRALFLEIVKATGKLAEQGQRFIPNVHSPKNQMLSLPTSPESTTEKAISLQGLNQGDPMTTTESSNSEQKESDIDMSVIGKKELELADSQGIAQAWKILPPEKTDYYDVEDVASDCFGTSVNWNMVVASRRGKLHAHKGSFREDAFAMAETKGWHIMVVADGGGSCSLARAGSNLAAITGVEAMKKSLDKYDNQNLTIDEYESLCKKALTKGLEEAWLRLEQESIERGEPLKEFGTTYLACIHYPHSPTSHLIGVLQVGDGVVVAEVNGKPVVLADPDVGESASVTLFLTSKRWDAWIDRVKVETISPPTLLAVMCDGVGDDFIPYDQLLPRLFNGLKSKVISAPDNPEQGLLELLNYEKRGSFDDRTLAILYPSEGKERLNTMTSSHKRSSQKLQTNISASEEIKTALLDEPETSISDTSEADSMLNPSDEISVDGTNSDNREDE